MTSIWTPGSTVPIYPALALPSGSNSVGFIQPESIAVPRTLQDKGRDVKNMKDYGLKLDGITDDTDAWNAMMTKFVTLGKKVRLVCNGTGKFSNTIIMPTTFVQVDATNGTLDFTSMPAGTIGNLNIAILVLGSGEGAPYTQTAGGLDYAEIIGATKANYTIAMAFNTATERGPSHSQFYGLNVHGFKYAYYLTNNTYCIDFWGVDAYACETAVYMPPGIDNAGERICFHGGTIYNNDFAVVNENTLGAMHLDNVSLDYNGVQCVAKAGRIFLSNCHVEAKNYASAPFVTYNTNGATIVQSGGWMLCTGTGIDLNTSTIYESQTDALQGGGIFVRDVSANNMGTGEWDGGAGVCDIHNIISYNTTNNPTMRGDTNNNLVDGGFEMASVYDAFITSDTVAITSRTVGTNINLTTSNTEFRSGAKSLKMAKTFGGGTACGFAIGVNLTNTNAIANYIGYYKKPGAEAGLVFVADAYVKIINVNGIDTIVKSSPRGLTTLTFTSAAVPWTKLLSGEPQSRAPAWATHYVVTVNADNFGVGNIYFDDFKLTQI